MKIAVIRFSSLGDVAMTVPVLQTLLVQHPNVQLIVISRPAFQSLFEELPRTEFVGFDIDNEYKSVWKLAKIASEIKKWKPNAVADLHNVLRTKIIKFFFCFQNSRISTLNKGRTEKKKATRKFNKILVPLTSMHERYASVFAELGFPIQLEAKAFTKKPIKTIGFAPFAKYEEKMLPLNQSKELSKSLAEKGYRLYLFGGKTESEVLSEWENMHENIHSLAGKMNLKEELTAIKNVDVMISMDSANMHLASLVGTRTISVWGATHPFLGFLGYRQNIDDAVQIEELTCRPCSVFGNKPCFRNDLACVHGITIKSIEDKINS